MSKVNLFKRILLFVFIMVVMASATASAQIREDQVNLGGLDLTMTYDDVIACFGPPDVEKPGNFQLVDKVIMYGDDIEISFLNNKIRKIMVSGDNGWATSDGVRFGMPLAEAFEIYGKDYESIMGVAYQYMCVSKKSYSYTPGDTNLVLRMVDSDNSGRIHYLMIIKGTPEY